MKKEKKRELGAEGEGAEEPEENVPLFHSFIKLCQEWSTDVLSLHDKVVRWVFNTCSVLCFFLTNKFLIRTAVCLGENMQQCFPVSFIWGWSVGWGY